MGNKQSTKTEVVQIDRLPKPDPSPVDNSNLEQLKQKRFPFENVVFEGGNNKLLAYCGAVKILEETGIWNKITRLAGSGKGALLASLLATGFNSDHLQTLLSDDLRNLFTGCNPGKKVLKWIREKLKEATGKADITFEEVYERFRKELCIVLTNLSQGCVEYCHVKTTPDMSVATAVCLSLGICGSDFKTKYSLTGGCPEVLTSGRTILNYPILCFDGWWLSMKPENSFLNKIQNLNQLPQILDRRNRFGEYNRATIGIAAFDDSSLNQFLLTLPSGQKGEQPPETVLSKSRTTSEMDQSIKLEKYAQLVTSLNKVIELIKVKKHGSNYKIKEQETVDIHAMLKDGHNDIIGRQDVVEILEKGALSDADLVAIFETKPSADEILRQINADKKNEVTVEDLIKFSDRKRLIAHAQWTRDRCRSIKKCDEMWDVVNDVIQDNNFRINTRKIDWRRTVGVNTGFIRRSDLGSKLENSDRKYLVEQGQLAMRIFLEKYDSSVPHEKGLKLEEVLLEKEGIRQALTPQIGSKQFIDDDIAEVIDERDYMDTYFEKVL